MGSLLIVASVLMCLLALKLRRVSGGKIEKMAGNPLSHRELRRVSGAKCER
jgi:hypothetical protein